MACLLDTGILLRLVNNQDPLHSQVNHALEVLRTNKEDLFTTTQNVAEFWNVATRPLVNNGLGRSVAEALDLLERMIEPVCAQLVEHEDTYTQLKSLGRKYGFGGKQVHDARLMAMMICWKVDTIFTLNVRHFQNYRAEGIRVVTLDDLLPRTSDSD